MYEVIFKMVSIAYFIIYSHLLQNKLLKIKLIFKYKYKINIENIRYKELVSND